MKWTWILGLAANQVRIWRRFVGTAKVLAAIRPDAVLTLGDNNTRAVRWRTSGHRTQTPGVPTAISPSQCRNARGYFAYFG